MNKVPELGLYYITVTKVNNSERGHGGNGDRVLTQHQPTLIDCSHHIT